MGVLGGIGEFIVYILVVCGVWLILLVCDV